MNLSELIARIGDDNVTLQSLDVAVSTFQATKQGTKAEFVTTEGFDVNGFHKLGLIVWLDRKAVADALASVGSDCSERFAAAYSLPPPEGEER